MNFRWMDADVQSPRPALDLIWLACMSPEQARQSLRSLLVSDPNYFGSLSDGSFRAVLQIQEDTTYERLCRIEYHSELEMLRATFEVNKANGYSTDPRSTGSLEYVRFYLSHDDGMTWNDYGVRVAHVFDAPGPKPLGYAVTQPVRLSEMRNPAGHSLRVRAILSWNRIPPDDTPSWLPVWGNVLETWISPDALTSASQELNPQAVYPTTHSSSDDGLQGGVVAFRSVWTRGEGVRGQTIRMNGDAAMMQM